MAWDESVARLVRRRVGRAARRTLIVPWIGYGNERECHISGRVLRDPGLLPPDAASTRWSNLRQMVRRFASDPVEDAVVRADLGGPVVEATSDDEGYFAIRLPTPPALAATGGWGRARLSLGGAVGHETTAEVLVPAKDASFAVVSDLDDTVIRTNVGDVIGMARTVFFGNARTRLPFAGVAPFYRALHDGPTGSGHNPIVYLSGSPWNLHDVLLDFLALQELPKGPLLLRDWGIRSDQRPHRHIPHKKKALAELLALWPHLPFVLVGDSSQDDPEIYADTVARYAGRIRAVYVRDVSPDGTRDEAVRTLAEQVLAAGSALVLAEDTHTVAEHAAAHGLIDPARLAEVEARRVEDGAPEAAPSTMVVAPRGAAAAAAAVESGLVADAVDATRAADAPTDVIVERADST